MKAALSPILVLLILSLSFAKERSLIVALSPSGETFDKALGGLASELGEEDYEVQTLYLDQVDMRNIHNANSLRPPSAMVLMDGEAIRLALQREKTDSIFRSIPKFIMMTLQADSASKELHNATGVLFEVPAYTSFTHFRIISAKDFSRIGVLYRKRFQRVVDNAKNLLAAEKIEIRAHCLDCDSREKLNERQAVRKMKQGLKELINKDKIEVLWMLADNILVNNLSLERFWMTRVRKSRLPVLVPLERFADPRYNLGIFATRPDYEQLGAQLAGLVIRVLEEGNSASELPFEPLISIRSMLNLRGAERIDWELEKQNLNRVDRIVGENKGWFW